ncbi:MATE family efflux transporter [Kamptonema formosum]|uniref:MATE family efflux transporter n=1 Tax=Kamptonema formosum TaxID=331992 RepID=UPI0005C52F5B|nr:MATE family efflux transporter [Oscillatoria sp. PCC 10802]
MQITSTKFKSELLSEALESLRLVVPLVITQLCDTAINAVDVVMMGLLGTQSLAAGALGAITFSTSLYVVYGITSGVGAMAAEAFGAGKTDQIGRVACQGLWLVAAMSIPVMLFTCHCDSILLLLGQEESNALLAKTYSRALVWGFPAAAGVLVLKDIASAIKQPRFVTIIMVAGLLLNVPANYVLMFGKLGFPPLGLAGIGWTSSLIFWVNFLAASAFLAFHTNFKHYQLFRYLHQFDRDMFVKIFQTGWPMGIHFGAEIALLNVTAWLMGYLGTVMLAAHQIAIQTAEIFLVIPAAITCATVARVGQRLGEENPFGARISASVSIAFGAMFTFAVALILWLFSDRLVAIYLDINNPDNTEAVKTAISFLNLAALYQITYGIQMIAVGALLGVQDTRIPMLVNLLAFWIVGLGGSYLMGLTLGWGGIGLWWGLILGPAISAVILIWRFYFIISEKLASLENVEDRARTNRARTISSQPLDDAQASIS